MGNNVHDTCSDVPEKNRCAIRKKTGKCPAKVVGKVCISKQAGKNIPSQPTRFASINIMA